MFKSLSKLSKSASGFASIFVFFAFLLTFSNAATAQTSTEFWFAPPEVTQGHAGSVPIYLRLAAGADPAIVTIEMPANAAAFNGGSPITVNLPANGAHTEVLSSYVDILETRPTGVVRNTGLKITATADITAIYEVSPTNNPDIWALKGLNGLGTEFYTPFQNVWRNGGYTPTPYTSFDIVATEDNTTILVYPTADLDGGQPAFQSFTITLNEGETYSGSVTDPNNPQNNPTGTQIISDKPIAVSIKDDSINPAPGYGGCRDLNGDQLVPVNIVGDEYIVNKGALNSDDLAMVVATQNNTVIEVDGVVVATLFNGETKRIQISNPLTYITGSKPFYLIQVTGFGCETGTALLPPLNCAGSEQVSFVRSTGESFFLNLLVPDGNQDAFVLNGNATIIDPSIFNVVPGTGGYWVGAQIEFPTAQIAVGAANLLINTEEVFSMGLINGGSSSGCRFGYFSQFAAEIIVDAGIDQTVCANRVTQLTGNISGGATNGVWSSNGTGSFSPDEYDLNAIYEPSPADLSAGSVTLTLTSISNCFPVEDEVEITYTPAPIVDAGLPITACENNTVVTLNGYVDVASGAIWSGGGGTYSPHSGVLNATYTPSAAEVTNGSVMLYLTSTGNGTCFAEMDSVLITFGPSPTANANIDQILCENNNIAQLNGSVTIAGGGQWSSPTGGSFLPSNQSLTPTYTPSNADLINGSVTITFTTTDNSGCSPVSDQMVITYTDAPVVDAGSDRTVCKNNADVTLNGTVSNATGGTWTGGTGTFSPDANTLNATYTPSLNDKINGSVTLTLTSTGNGDCIAESDAMVISFTNEPTVNAGTDGFVCSNNAAISLNGSLTIATIGLWSSATGGTFNNTTALNAIYTPSAADLANGSVTLTLTSLDNGTCNPVSDDVTYTFTPSPTANAGLDRDICENNAAITLNGSATLAGGGAWSGGNGTYSPDNTSFNAVYTPTNSELSSGSVTLTLSTTANGTCNPATDQVTFTFTDAPTANAGADKIVCANNAAVNLTGAVTIATGGTWSGGLGTYSPNANSLNATYSPTTTEINSGSLTLTLTTTGNATCSPVSDDVLITFTPAPTVDAGTPISVCSNNAQVSLGGSVTVAGGATWSGGAGTFSPNANSLNAIYTPTPAEIASGSLILTLTSTGNGTCTAVQDVVSISFTPAPTANAGADVTVCNNNAVVDLNGSISLATGGIWSGGSGSFNPNNTTLGASYTPSNAELANGTATLTLTTTGNANCNAVQDQMTITITPPPTVNAGADDVYCANNPVISLGGAVTVASGATWSGGSGSFSPNASDLNATYTPSQSEINNGSLTLTLTSTGNSNCIAVTDQVTYTFSPAPTAEAGGNQSLCANNNVASLSGAVTIATGGTWSGGAGSFANANALNTTYTAHASEITAGSVKLYLTTTNNGDCNAVTDSLTITYTPAPTANAGADRTVCANAPDVTLNGAVTVATGGTWSGGTGTYATNASDLSAVYTPSAAEIAAGTVTLTLTTTGNANCNQVTDQMVITITPAPVVNAGADEELCANNAAISLGGSVTIATGGAWSGGAGTYAPNANDLNAVYTPSAAEITAGTVTLTLSSTGNGLCTAVTDQVTYTFSPAPTADAGLDQSLCANNNVASLTGAVTVATGGTWSGGAGTFSSVNSLNTNYTPSAAELTAGTVTLTLTTTGNDDCNAVSDNVVLTYTPAPTANAGIDRTVCANASDVTLNGAVTIATGGIWSGGTGTFSTNASDLSAVYSPSAAEIAAGTATLTLTTTGNANCNQVTDQMVITITPAPVVNAGTDEELCSNNSAISLSGSVTIATGGTWSGGTGTFAPNANDLNAIYTPSQSELNAGTLTLTLTSTGNNSCVAVTDQVTYTFSPAPTADAGIDQTLCANNAVASLTGAVTVATGGTWTTNGSGTFSSANTLSTNYTPSAADITAGTVTLTLTTTGNDDCNAVSDNMVLTFTPAPTANAGTDKTVCANASEVSLNGSISIASGGTWSGGTGTFTPDANTLNPTYTPSAADIAAGSVTLTLTTTGNGTCIQVTDQMVITITPAPIVNAGSDEEFCANNAAISLGGSVTTATGATWSGGNGTFAPNANDLNAVYTPSQGEINAGTLTLTLTSTGNGSCVPVSDDVVYTFSPAPVVEAGADQILCANNAEAAISGTVSVASGGTWSGGAGNFSPSANSLNAFYTPTPEEITAGSVTLKLTSTGNSDCNAVTDSLKISFTPAPTANAGLDRTVCANAADVSLNGTVSVATGGTWSGGSGTFAPDANTLNAVYTPSADDITNGSVTLTLTTTGNGTCIQVTDQMIITITPEPTVDAGTGTEYCSNNAAISLGGSVTTATGGIWSGGNGTYAPNANDLNAVYTPSQAEINSGSVTLTLTSSGNGSCVAVTDQVTYTFGPTPTANAGVNQSLCANNAVAELTGAVTIATGGTWSGGAGTFTNANSLNTFYTPTAAEITAGTVTLTLTTTGNDDCSAVSDDIIINFTPAPTSNAGTDKTVCANDPEVNLNGSVSIATGGTWSGGSGTFTPDANALNAIYTPSAADISAGTVTLTLTTTGNANCNQVTDQMVITITPAPVVNAGIGFELCANNAVIDLNGSVTGATGGTWSGGNGTLSPNASALNATYTPSQGEINSGSVTLTLTSTGNGLCLAEQNSVTYTFSPAPTADAGVDQTLCANNEAASLNGAVTIATGGTWSGGAGSFSPNANTLNAVYTPTATEIANGSVTLTLTTTGNDDCNAVSDSLKLTFTPAPTANAGTDKTVCANNVEVSLNGNVSIATGGIWSGGNGTFDPSNTTLGATYTPSAAEIAAGQVILTLTTTGNGNCVSESDDILITINPEPVVNAGADQMICSNNAAINLNGSVANATGGQWSGGLGTYNTSSTDLSATYTPTLPEIVSGSVTFTLTSTGNGGCIAVTDQMTVTFTPSPTVNAGTDITLCESSPVASLNGSFTVAGGAQWSGGAGSFSPNALAMNATYTPTAAEVANGSVTLTLTTISNGNCLAETDEVVINFDPQPTVNAGANLVSCANNQVVSLNGSFTNADGVLWSGGLGFFNPSNQDPSASYTPSNAEIINGGVTLTLTTVGSGACAAVSDNVTISISPAPIVNAGADQSACANNSLVQLNGDVEFAGGGQWSGGSGTFSPSANALSATYQPSAADISAGFVTLTLTSVGNGTCNPVTDQMIITITPAPIADAGTDITACENNATVQLNGSFTVAEGANWSGGAGSFNPSASDVNALYTPSQSELNNGTVTLTLTTFGNGTCLPASDQVVLNFTPAPEVDAGEDYFVCVDQLIVPLSGSVSGPTSSGIWTTSGTGVFVPNAAALNGTYQVSSADSLAGQITLTLTSTGNGLCTPVTDEILVHISPAGTANAGADQEVCKNNPNVSVTGTIGGAATSGTWLTSGTGVFTPNADQPSVNYIPSTADLNAGNVTLTFAVNSCNQATDDVLITFTPSPVVAAGTDITVCSSEDDVQLLGSVSGASATGVWTSSGSGNFIPNANTLNAVYEFSADDVDDQVITLILKATDIGNCINVSDTLTLNIFPEGTAEAGEDVVACDNNPEVQLQGVLTGADQALWTTSGTGTFAPNAQTLNATYVPSEGDLVNGSVNIILAGVNSCNNATDFMNISFTDGPDVDAGADQAACGDVFPFQVTGTFANSAGAQWSTSGTGTFQNANNPNTFYVASQNDIDNGGVYLMLTSTGNGNCFPVTDSLLISISSGVTVDAGEDRSACVDAGTIQLYGNISNGSTTGTWTTSGNGTFSPNANAINAVYNFTQQDIDGGSLTLTLTSTNNGICNPASDSFELTFGTAAYVFAGANIDVCQTIDLVELHGVVSSETNTGVWSTAGDGTFFPNIVALDAFYEPGPNDLAAGETEITLTSTNSTLCSETSSLLTIYYQSLPVADASADQVICGDIEAVQMLGNVQNATGGVWSTAGSGTFFPNDSVLTALYTPSSADSLNGSVTLTLTTYGNGMCGGDMDQMQILFSGAVTALAGSDQNVCIDADVVSLIGAVEGSDAYQWGTMGTGSFVPSAANLTTNYEPSESDKALGGVTLYLQAAGTGNCPSDTDSLYVAFDALPVIVTQAEVESCVTNTEVALASDVSGAASVLWTSPGGGTFSPNGTVQDVIYNPTAGEVASGNATVILEAISGNACGTVTESVNITFRNTAIVNAGADLVACETDGAVTLSGAINGAGYGGQWSTNAFGSFSPNATQLDADYTFGNNDILIGSAKLILTSTNNGACPAVSDTVEVAISRQAVADAGADAYVCKSTGMVALNGNAQHAESTMWTTLGDGVFLPSGEEIDAEYVIGNADGNSGFVNLILTATALQGCADRSDTVMVNISNPLSAAFSHGNACAGSTIQFMDETEVFSGSISSWRWDFGDGNISNQQNPQFVYTTPGSRSVELVVSSTLGCNDTIVQLVNVVEGPKASFEMSDNPAPINFDVRFTDTSVGAQSWNWTFGDLSGSTNVQNPTHAYPIEGNYDVTLTVIGESGCADTSRTTIVIEGFLVLPPRLPNTFSPNGDGINDEYLVRGGPFTELEFTVYDGWGSKIFSTTDQNIGWDGTEGGKQSPVGVYVYTVIATNLNGDQFDYSGKINLIR